MKDKKAYSLIITILLLLSIGCSMEPDYTDPVEISPETADNGDISDFEEEAEELPEEPTEPPILQDIYFRTSGSITEVYDIGDTFKVIIEPEGNVIFNEPYTYDTEYIYIGVNAYPYILTYEYIEIAGYTYLRRASISEALESND